MLAITHASGTPYAVGYVAAQSSLRRLLVAQPVETFSPLKRTPNSQESKNILSQRNPLQVPIM
jgi:hypothetical protein